MNMNAKKLNRPHTTVVLAMSADGKISDVMRSPILFGSAADKAHLETQVALADAVLGGAGTLRAGGSAMPVSNPELLAQRKQQGKPPQPTQIICSRSGKIDPQIRFFQQPISRWLVTTKIGVKNWRSHSSPDELNELNNKWEQIFTFETPEGEVDLLAALAHFAQMGIQRLAVLGGGELVGSLLTVDAIDELWLTVCPLLIGGDRAPTPVDGPGLPTHTAPRLQLLEVKQVDQELFLHYSIKNRVS